jgi:predicted permease
MGVLTVVVGTAALATVYSTVHATLVAPLPFPDGDRLVVLEGRQLLETGGMRGYPLGYQDLRDLDAGGSLEAVAPVTGVRSFNLQFGSAIAHVSGELVGDAYFPLLRLTPAAGRWFTGDEASAERAARVVVIGHALWQRDFGDGADALGQRLQLNGRPFEIVGVAPEGFRGLTDRAELWLPMGTARELYQPGYLDVRQFRWLDGLARLAPNATVESAATAVDLGMQRLEQAHGVDNRRIRAAVLPLSDRLRGDLRAPLTTLLGASGFVLLIACVNLAGLLFVRGSARRREFAVSLAIGAGRRHLVGQLLLETLLLVAAGTVGGLGVALGAMRVLAANPPDGFASFIALSLNWPAIGLTTAAVTTVALAFGLLPVWIATSVHPGRSLHDGERGSTRGTARFQHLLVASEVALACALLVGASLMVRGFSRFTSQDLGYVPDGLLTMRFDLTAERYRDNPQFWATVQAIADAAARVPGVERVALEGPGFPTSGTYAINLRPEGAEPNSSADVQAIRHHVTPGYFQLMNIPIVEGRGFTDADRTGAVPAVVVSREFARRVWPDASALGQRVLAGPAAQALSLTVVGVAGNVRHTGFTGSESFGPDVYISLFQYPPRTPAIVTLAARGRPDQPLARLIPDAARAAAPDVPPYDVQTVRERLGSQTASARWSVTLMAGFAIASLTLAIVGLYGVTSFMVARRTREIGVRLALGATSRGVVLDVVRGSLVPVAAGLVAGAAMSVILGRLASSMLYGLEPTDPASLAVAIGVLVGAAALGSYIPARRAGRVDPLVALRDD